MTADQTLRREMKLNRLGRSGTKVSQLALGTMTFGTETDEPNAFRQLDMFVDHGGTFIDTADGYSAGRSEEIIGRWASQRGGMNDLILATKGRFSPPPGSEGASRRSLVHSVDASLKRLQRDAIDLYFIHGWDPHTDVIHTLAALGDLMQAGKIHAIGWSNVSGWQLQKIVSTATAHGLPAPVVLQPQYNLLERGIELEVLPCCLENGIALTPWSPLGGGWLTGKYTSQQRPSGATRLGEDPNRGEGYDALNVEKTYRVVDVASRIAKRYDRPMSHVALAWLATRPGIASILLGARTTEQLKDNLAASDLKLEPSELNELTAVSACETLPYPYSFLEEWCGVETWKAMGTRTQQSG